MPAGDQCRRCGGETEIMHGSGKVRCHHCDEVVPYSCGSKARIDATAADSSCSADGSRIDDTAAVCGASGPGVSTAIGSCAIDHGVIAATVFGVCPMIVVVVPIMLGRSRSTSQEDAP